MLHYIDERNTPPEGVMSTSAAGERNVLLHVLRSASADQPMPLSTTPLSRTRRMPKTKRRAASTLRHARFASPLAFPSSPPPPFVAALKQPAAVTKALTRRATTAIERSQPQPPASVSPRRQLQPPIEIFDVALCERRRRLRQRAARLVREDESGVRLMRKQLCTFTLLQRLGLGRERTLRVADIDGMEELWARLMLRSHVGCLQRPQKRPIESFYYDDDAELEGESSAL